MRAMFGCVSRSISQSMSKETSSLSDIDRFYFKLCLLSVHPPTLTFPPAAVPRYSKLFGASCSLNRPSINITFITLWGLVVPPRYGSAEGALQFLTRATLMKLVLSLIIFLSLLRRILSRCVRNGTSPILLPKMRFGIQTVTF